MTNETIAQEVTEMANQKVAGQITLTVLKTGDVISTPVELEQKYLPFLAAALAQLNVNILKAFIAGLFPKKKEAAPLETQETIGVGNAE